MDVAALVDIKANSSDVFRIFEEIKRTIEMVTSKQQSLEATKSFE
jgi:hypothetical protein